MYVFCSIQRRGIDMFYPCYFPNAPLLEVLPDEKCGSCLLYTSDAADDLLCVDLGGRRIIKKKTICGVLIFQFVWDKIDKKFFREILGLNSFRISLINIYHYWIHCLLTSLPHFSSGKTSRSGAFGK